MSQPWFVSVLAIFIEIVAISSTLLRTKGIAAAGSFWIGCASKHIFDIEIYGLRVLCALRYSSVLLYIRSSSDFLFLSLARAAHPPQHVLRTLYATIPLLFFFASAFRDRKGNLVIAMLNKKRTHNQKTQSKRTSTKGSNWNNRWSENFKEISIGVSRPIGDTTSLAVVHGRSYTTLEPKKRHRSPRIERERGSGGSGNFRCII